MAAYLVGQIAVKDEVLWKQYVEGVAESVEPFDATIVFRGQRNRVLAGVNPRDLIVVIEFSEHDELEAWFNSEKYQSIIELRDRAADVVITTYQA